MKHAAKTMCLTVIVVIICAIVPATAIAVELPKTAKLAPPETVLLVDIDNFSRLQYQFEKTNSYKLYKDPAMAAFIEHFKTKLKEKIRKKSGNLAETIIDSDILPQGRTAFALVLTEEALQKKEPMALFIIDWGKNSSKFKETLDKIVEKAIEKAARQKSEDYRGVSIKTIIAAKDERLGYGLSSTISYCFIDDCLVGSEDIEIVKFVIAHIKGAGSPALAADADYTAMSAAVGPYHDVDVYVNIKHITKMLMAKDTSGRAKMMMANLGIDNVMSLGLSLGIARSAGSSLNAKALLKINGARRGILRMLEMEPRALRAPRFIPASSSSATFLNLNIKKAYNELAMILNSFGPMYTAWMYTPLPTSSSPDEPGLQIKGDVIDHLGSQIILSQKINKPISVTKPTETMVALAVNDRGALEKSLSLLHNKLLAPNNPDARRELLGHTIYSLNLPAFPFMGQGMKPMQGPGGAPGMPQIPKIAFTVTDSHLVFGAEPAIEAAIRALSSASGRSIDSAKWFTATRSAIPSAVGLASLEDSTAGAELLWNTMKESGKNKPDAGDEEPSISIGLGANSKPSLIPGVMFSQQGMFDTNLLPAFDVVRKYFGLSASYAISRPDGYFFEIKYLNTGGNN